MMIRTTRHALAALVLAAGLGACSLNDEFGGTGLLEETEARRAQWEAANVANYRFVYGRDCFDCSALVKGPFEVFVVGGLIDSVAYAGAEAPAAPPRPYVTIDGLFDEIESIIAEKPQSLSLRFDPDRGYPVRIFADFDRARGGDETLLEVSGFTVL